MAQTGYTPIQLYYSTTASAVPTAGNLNNGELAINITDGKLYYKNNSGVVTLLAGATSGPAGGSNTQVQYNSSGVLAGSANLTFNGTTLTANTLNLTNALGIAYGGTGQITANAAFNALAPSQTGNSGKYLTTDGTNTSWATNAGGDVVGPSSATDNALARFDTTTGKLIQNSVGILSDAGALSGLTDISASGSVTLSGGTANGVTYLNGSKVLTSGSALTFDGTSLGINTTSPGALLGVNGTAMIGNQASSGTSGSFAITGVGGAVYLQTGQNTTSASAAPLVFTNMGATSEWMRITNSGNVGIGTSSPGAKLDVDNGSAGFVAKFKGGTRAAYVYTDNNAAYISTDTGLYTAIGLNETNDYFNVYTNNAERMRIDSSGNVGIGTSSPSYTATNRGNLNIAGSSGGILGFQMSGVAKGYVFHNGTDFQMWNEVAGTVLFATNALERMRIDSAGNVGIGTSSPSVTLSVAGTIGIFGGSLNGSLGSPQLYRPAADTLAIATGATERARISADGTFQVGRTSGSAPDGKLQVGATGTGAGAANTKLGFALIEDDSGNGAGLWLGAMTNQNTGVIGSRTASGNIAFQTYNGGWGERARITYDGNLLVGGTTAYGQVSATKSIAPAATPSNDWGIDFASSTAPPNYIALAASATYDLATGSGFVILHNNNGEAAAFITYGGTVTKLGGSSTIVSGAAGANQVGLVYNGGTSKYRISNGYGSTQNIFVTTIRTRTSS